MALSVPTNITPSTSSGLGAGVVDVTQGFTVSWQVNGNSPMVAYQYVIMQNDIESTKVYDSGKVTLAQPFYGRDYKGNEQFFSFDIAASALSSLSNGYANGYKAVITQWWSATDSLAQPSASFFITRSTPTIQINAIPNPLNTKSYQFSASYEQAQGDTLDWFRWVIQDSEGNVLKDTQEIYGTEDIRTDYDGFFGGQEYTVTCFIQTENGVQAQTQPALVSVLYASVPITGFVQACKKGEAVQVSWPDLAYIFGTAAGAYTIQDEQILLPHGSSITWDTVTGRPMQFLPPWSVYYKGKPRQGAFLTLHGAGIVLEMMGPNVLLKKDGETIATVQAHYTSANWMEIVLTPYLISVKVTVQIGGLAPSLSLAPSLLLAPKDNTETLEQIYTVPVNYTQQPITSVVLSGEQTCKYLWIAKRELAFGEFPAFDADTYFLADFSNGLNAGNVKEFDGDVTGAAIYRQDNGGTFLNHICDVALGDLSLMDFGAPSQGTYIYYVFFTGASTYLTAPILSNPVTPLFWNWTLLQCQPDEQGVYHVQAQYPFSCNIATGEISNNNAPNILENFTIYPKVQPASANYNSGVLQAYIGSVNQMGYQDTIEQAQKIYALSLSSLPLFLKDRKGNIWRISISAPTTMKTSDNSRPQMYLMSLNWVEIGPVDNAIVSTLADAFWEVAQ